jgi:hypothetical protein
MTTTYTTLSISLVRRNAKTTTTSTQPPHAIEISDNTHFNRPERRFLSVIILIVSTVMKKGTTAVAPMVGVVGIAPVAPVACSNYHRFALFVERKSRLAWDHGSM